MAIYQKLQNLLFDVGFSEAEVCLYIELLKKPLLRVWELVQKTGLSKSTVYDAFSKLKKLQMVEKTGDGIRALSLKALVAELNRNKKRLDKTAYKIKQIAPFLRVPNETVEEFETLYTPEQIREAYILMSEIPYSMNLDFGDFENFITAMGGNSIAYKFRGNRAKHASQHGLLTNFGPNTAEFCTREAMTRFKNQFNFIKNIDFKKKWIILSDSNDYVMYNDVSDPEFPVASLVKSKTIADMERARFKCFSDKSRNF